MHCLKPCLHTEKHRLGLFKMYKILGSSYGILFYNQSSFHFKNVVFLSHRKSKWSLRVSRRTSTRCLWRQRKSCPRLSPLPLLRSCAPSSTSPCRRWITPTCSPLFILTSESSQRETISILKKCLRTCGCGFDLERSLDATFFHALRSRCFIYILFFLPAG